MNNRLANTKNMYQTAAKKVLCLCSAGLLRSPTMANVLHKEYGYNTRAAGTSKEYALIPVDNALCFWADEIVCANKDVFDALDKEWTMDKRVIILDVPDKYEWNDAELRKLVHKQYSDVAIMEKAK